MDPESRSFTPYSTNSDAWRLQGDVVRIQQVQAEHADRIARLERRQDEDARVKSVWGSSSPFPSVLSGTPQQAPLQQPPSDQFRGFDDEANNLMSSLHLDAEDDGPRRNMANSRANSVRFDESANQNHFSHSSRPSMDFMSRTSSGLGGLQMSERSSSHKSEGRASSQHSMRSAASGRANSINLETATGYGLGDSNRSPLDTPALAPGLYLLGSVPAIIRCWMNTNFKHDALLYAAVCTGSYRSYLDMRLIRKLGFEDEVHLNEDSARVVQLPVYFPEAVPHPASSRSASSSPAPQLPTLTVKFHVVEHAVEHEAKAIQIFIGSDVLRSHNADILFSSNSITLFDDDRSKLSIPLVRPEDAASFNSLYVSSGTPHAAPLPAKAVEQVKEPYLNGLGQGSSGASLSSAAASPPPGKYRPPGAIAAEAGATDSSKAGSVASGNDDRPASRQSSSSRPSLATLNTQQEASEQPVDATSTTTPSRSGSTPQIWSSWRRDGATAQPAQPTQPSGLDWAKAGQNREPTYQRKESGIKVLKPKTASRTFSTTSTTGSAAPSPSIGDGSRSRFFDEGRRRSGPDAKPALSTASSSEAKKENQTPVTATKTKSNPIGGGSAFSWLNPSGAK